MPNSSTVRTPLPGRVLLVASGGACPGGQAILEAAYDFVRGAIDPSGKPLELLTARGGMARVLAGDASCLSVVTRDNIRPMSPCSAPILSFCKGGPTSDDASQVELCRALRRFDIRYLLVWGGQFSLSNLANTVEVAARLAQAEGDAARLFIGGLVKSIDNDAAIPGGMDSIGFVSAAKVMARTLKGLARDAQNSDTMVHVPILSGNQVGHLTERASRMADLPLCIIPERLAEGTPLNFIIDIIIGAWLKGAIRNPAVTHLVVPIAEGVLARLDERSCPGLAEAKRRSHEGVTANHYPLSVAFQDAAQLVFAQIKNPPTGKISLRSAYHGYAARGAEADSLDIEMARLHASTALDALARRATGNVYFGTQHSVTSAPLASLRRPDGRGMERGVDLSDRVVSTYWSAHGSWRLQPADLEGESLRRICEILGLDQERTRERFGPVANWGA